MNKICLITYFNMCVDYVSLDMATRKVLSTPTNKPSVSINSPGLKCWIGCVADAWLT